MEKYETLLIIVFSIYAITFQLITSGAIIFVYLKLMKRHKEIVKKQCDTNAYRSAKEEIKKENERQLNENNIKRKNNKFIGSRLPRVVEKGDFEYVYSEREGTYLPICIKKLTDNSVLYKPEQPLEYLHGIKLTNYSNMFRFLKFEKIDLNHWDMSEITSISGMFDNCKSLVELHIDMWDVSNIISIKRTFFKCKSLRKLNANNLNFSKLKTAEYAFFKCIKLEEIESLNWDLPELMYANSMFSNCISLTKLDTRYWKMERLVSAGSMFFYCISIKYLDLSGWKLSMLSNARQMFGYSKNLTSINRRSISIIYNGGRYESEPNYRGVFSGCRRMEKIEVIKAK